MSMPIDPDHATRARIARVLAVLLVAVTLPPAPAAADLYLAQTSELRDRSGPPQGRLPEPSSLMEQSRRKLDDALRQRQQAEQERLQERARRLAEPCPSSSNPGCREIDRETVPRR
ncbi:hypothetical protein [Polymorphum gilvum]|uniref:Uncharacterized protein n=1 Tax=Polymorphum gilvum (strain LMG 25793 / CGMCC 1.9160 / SL003B-26A1) TaxID=991905 RepID=F2J0L2_POLGS|nr:hypothetical protein [Polymorphum gilvum]ADZ69681.1 hypothetical protein SL003B_1251 [Polymorphum gilvum SL003B-26A1]